MSFIFTDDQMRVLDAFNNGRCLFVSGGAGTGKTTLIREIISNAQADGRRVAVTASTGIAASLFPGGRTIHSLLGYHYGYGANIDEVNFFAKANRLENVDVLIIDEISMLGRSFVPFLYYCLLYADHPIQLIIVGDFFQLPPVHDDYAFQTSYWDALKLTPCLLRQVVRQKDEEMVRNINKLKYGDPGCLPYFISRSCTQRIEQQITICARKENAQRINQQELDWLPGRSYHYSALIDGNAPDCDIPVEQKLVLKVGARVMATVNSDEYVNGSLGTVINLEENEIDVVLDTGVEIRFFRREFDSCITGDPVEKTTVRQFPLRLAHAITIHSATCSCMKSAGMIERS